MSKKILLTSFCFLSFGIFSLSPPEYSTSKNGLRSIDNFIKELISYSDYYEGFESENNLHSYCVKNPSYQYNKCMETDFEDRRIYFLGKIIEKHLDSFLREERSNNSKKFGMKVSKLTKELDYHFSNENFSQKELIRELRNTLNRNKKRVSDALRDEFYSSQKYLSSLVSLEVNSNIKGSSIYLDGNYLGKTPLVTDKIYTPKKYTLEIRKSFLTRKIEINLLAENKFFIDLKDSKGDMSKIRRLETYFKDGFKSIEENLSLNNLELLISTKRQSQEFIDEFKSLNLEGEKEKLKDLRFYINELNEKKIENLSENILSSRNSLDDLIKTYDQLEKINPDFKERRLIKLSLSGSKTNTIKNDINASVITENEFDLEKFGNGFFISIFTNPIKMERNVISQNEKIGQYLSGTRQIPNGKYVTAKNNHDVAYNNYLIAKNRADASSKACYQQGSFFEQLLCGSLISALESGPEATAYRKAKDILERTPPYINEDIYSEYVYGETIVKAKKSQTVNVTQLNIDRLEQEQGQVSFEKADTFYIYTGLHPNEENPPKQQDTQEKLDNFLTQPVSNLKVSKIISKFEVLKEKTSKSFSSLNEVSILKNKNLSKNESGFFNKIFSSFWNENSDHKELEENEFEIDKRFESVVQINTLSASGTGFYIDDNLIVTNEHVVENNATVDVINFYKDQFVGEVIKVDRYRDLALISVSKKGFPVKIYRKSFLKLGSEVEALGHPIGFDYTLSRGIVSSTRKIFPYNASVNLGEVEYIQTDTDINPGNSGGPLFHDNEVVGVNTWKRNRENERDAQSRPVSGINFAISYKELINFLE